MGSRRTQWQWAVMDLTSGSLMGFPNQVLSTREAAEASLAWLKSEQDRKRAEHEADPQDAAKGEAWSRVAAHKYAVRCKEKTPWLDPAAVDLG